MTIDRGLCDWQTLQRGADNCAGVTISGTCDAPGGAVLEARVLHAGEPLPGWDWRVTGEVARGSWCATLTAIPAGGPYRIEVRAGAGDEAGAWVDEVLVGDLWVIAGQSNAEGCGLMRDMEAPSSLVHSFTSAERWAVAEEPLHWLCDSIDACHAELHEPQRSLLAEETHRTRTRGVGPGLAFAKAMVERTGVPIGLVPCAHGGTSMEQWDPALRDQGGASMYGSMVRRLQAVGGRARGVIWYQGESDAAPPQVEVFQERLDALVAAMRRDFGDPSLPFVHVQIGRFVADGGKELERAWNIVREAQRTLPDRVAGTAAVTAIDLPLDDGIHISNAGQQRLGRRLATATCAAILRHDGLHPGPRLQSARIESTPDGGRVRVSFDGVNDGLTAAGRVSGFSIRSPRGRDLWLIYRADIDRERPTDVLLWLNGPVPADARLWYGRGFDPYCNVTDACDMGVPAFGPVEIEGAR